MSDNGIYDHAQANYRLFQERLKMQGITPVKNMGAKPEDELFNMMNEGKIIPGIEQDDEEADNEK